MNLTALLADLYRRFHYASSPAAEVTTRLTAFLNEAQRSILRTPGLESLRNDTITLASVSGTTTYGLPSHSAVAEIQNVTERTNHRRLVPQSLEWLRLEDPGLTASGTPTVWVDHGVQQVEKQPSNASSVFVDSTSASDTNTCYIEGIRSGGYYRSVSVSMTGTTAVNVSSTTSDWIEITKFYLSAVAVGTVTLHEDADGGTELARIPIGLAYPRYRSIQLWPTPTAAVTYYVDYSREVPDMANGTDNPIVPFYFHDTVLAGARMYEFQYHDDLKRYQLAKSEYEKGLAQLVWATANSVGGSPNMRGRHKPSLSRLGAQFPSGT